MSQALNESFPHTLSAMAYALADSLRQQYLDNSLPIPINAREQAISQLMQNFAITQVVAESALAEGFFKSR